MKRRHVALALACGGAGAIGMASGPALSSHSLTHSFANLTGAKEVSPQGKTGVGDKDGHGAAAVDFAGSKLCFGLTVHGIDKPVAAHIHKGGARKFGGVVVTLRVPRSGNPGATGACVPVKAAVAQAIRRSPGSYYVNVHTKAFPDGAIRGQLFSAAGR
jgi:CHRD domain-containing protein